MINSDALTARVIHINLRLRKNGRAEDFVYELNEPIHLPKGVVCWCAALSVPYPWPNVCALNDQLYLIERSTTPGALTAEENSYQFTIPTGEYQRTQLATKITDAIRDPTRTCAFPLAVDYAVGASAAGEAAATEAAE